MPNKLDENVDSTQPGTPVAVRDLAFNQPGEHGTQQEKHTPCLPAVEDDVVNKAIVPATMLQGQGENCGERRKWSALAATRLTLLQRMTGHS